MELHPYSTYMPSLLGQGKLYLLLTSDITEHGIILENNHSVNVKVF